MMTSSKTNDRNSTGNPLILHVAAEKEQFGPLFNIDEYTII